MGRAGAWARSGLTDDAELVPWTAAKDVYPEDAFQGLKPLAES